MYFTYVSSGSLACIGVGSKPHGRSTIHVCLNIDEPVTLDLHILDAIDRLDMQIMMYEFLAMEWSIQCVGSR